MMLKISDNKINCLDVLKGKMLMSKSGYLYKIMDYKIVVLVETPEKTLFNRHPKPVEGKFVTNVEILSYHSTGRFLGTLSDDGWKHFLEWTDLYVFRDNWIKFVEQLHAFGLELKEIETTKTE